MANPTAPAKRIIRIGPQPGFQEKVLSCTADMAIVGGGAGPGKRLSIDTPIATPNGWSLIGDLVVGDVVFDDRGHPVTVTATHPVELSQEAYRLIFDDGSTVEADGEHLWVTFNAAELKALTRYNPVWRTKRRAFRPSRANGNRGVAFTAMMAARNMLHRPPCKEAPSGAIRTTLEISNTLRTRSGRANHAIPVTMPLDLEEQKYMLDPYLLGCWLGDGTAKEGSITSADHSIVQAFLGAGFTVTKSKSDPYGYYVRGLVTILRSLGVLDNKHIPIAYLRGSYLQRLEMLRGLMDTDGTVDYRDGHVSFSNTEPRLCDAVQELVHSLGWKSSRRHRKARLYGKEYGHSWNVSFSATEHVFHLERKKTLQKMAVRRTTKFRYVVRCERIEPRYMRCISVDSVSRLYLAGHAMIPTHNTWALMMDAARHHNREGWRALILRRTSPEITNPGAMWDESFKLYPKMGGKPTDLTWRWGKATSIKFGHCQHEKDRFGYDGAQAAFVGFDQVEHFTSTIFWHIWSRMRSTCGVRPYLRATANPVPEDDATGGWVHKLIQWWIDPDTGFTIKARDGIIQWFYRDEHNDHLIWADSREVLLQRVPTMRSEDAISFTFIEGRLAENVILNQIDPGYEAKLRALPKVERERLLNHNWNVRPMAGNVFNRSQFTIVAVAPADTQWVRYWDKAGTQDGGAYSAGVKMGYSPTTTRYYVGDVRHGQWAELERERMIKQTAQLDGSSVTIYVEQEPGSGGKESARHTVLNLAGFACYADRVKGDKYLRCRPYAAMVQAYNVDLVAGDWNEVYLSELHNYVPDSDGYKDQVDASSGAFNKLTAGKPLEILGAQPPTEEEEQQRKDEAAELARQQVIKQGVVFPGEW